MTLEGTNTYVVGRDPAVVIDPGPAEDDHIEAIRRAASERGGIGTVLLTHGHGDHSDGVESLGVEPARPADGEWVAGLQALATPGHAADHLCFLLPSGPDRDGPYACFTGDLILGEGSTIVGPRETGGSLRDYMGSLRRLQSLELTVLYPGHGPEIDDPQAKIAEYIAHRQEREDRLVVALDRGERSKAALLAEVWDDVPEPLRGAAAIAMQAHLEKLEDDGRLPADLRD
jgi:glyoxylase-like metal-dependent hydrolase (beta-lactamase superfamily II)